MIRALLVDDEHYANENLKTLLGMFCEGVEVVETANSVIDAIKKINKLKPDLVFLDIEMPGQNGFELLECFEERTFKTIFVTAYDHYALKAFKMHAVNYLLKPLDPILLKEAVEHVVALKKEDYNSRTDAVIEENRMGQDKIGIPIRNGVRYIPKSQIIYLEASGNYTLLYLRDEKPILVSKTIKAFESVLIEPLFTRIHRGNIVNIKEVKAYLKSNGGEVEMTNGEVLSISKSNIDKLRDRMQRISASV